MLTASLGYLATEILHKYMEIDVAEEFMNDVEILISPAISEVLRRIDSLKAAETIPFEEKIRIAELILSVNEEETDSSLMLQ
jgi:hypothetical protein